MDNFACFTLLPAKIDLRSNVFRNLYKNKKRLTYFRELKNRDKIYLGSVTRYFIPPVLFQRDVELKFLYDLAIPFKHFIFLLRIIYIYIYKVEHSPSYIDETRVTTSPAKLRILINSRDSPFH